MPSERIQASLSATQSMFLSPVMGNLSVAEPLSAAGRTVIA